VRYDIAPESAACAVPTLLVQPIVENAFRHGVARRSGGCRLEIGACIDRDRLHLWVRDDGAGLPEGFSLDTHGGVGLRNTHSRLRRMYGDAASLRMGSATGGGTEVHIEIPAQGAQRLQAVG
jgi:sensor histidine kinase YesM